MAFSISDRHPGGTIFFTARLADRNSSLLTREIDALRAAMRQTIRRYPFTIEAIAVLPSVIHTLWTLPPGDANHAVRWRMVRSRFAQSVIGATDVDTARAMMREKPAWQSPFWEHRIRDAQDFETHMHIIHTSPVQAGLCAAPQDWPHSSVHCRDKTSVDARPAKATPSRWPPISQTARTYREEGFLHHS